MAAGIRIRAGLRARLRYLGGAARVRTVISGAMLILGLGRAGLFSTSGVHTAVPEVLYGWLLSLSGASLLLSSCRLRYMVTGRALAGLAACCLVGFGADILAGHGSMTSVLLLGWLAVSAAVEALAEHEC